MNHSTLSRKALTTLLIGAYIGMLSPISAVHAVATITEVTPIPTYTTNQSPTYVFNSSTGGTIGYTGPCAAMLPSITTATSGNNNITFGPLLSDANYSTGASICGFTVDDGGGAGNLLNIPWFALDNTIPTISVTNSNITINKNDSYPT
jgi:hypothetical protein